MKLNLKDIYDWCGNCRCQHKDNAGYCLACIKITLWENDIALPNPQRKIND